MKLLEYPLRELPWYKDAVKTLDGAKSAIRISGCKDTQKLHMINALAAPADAAIIVTYNELRAKEIYDSYLFFDKNAVYYPAKDLIFYQSDINSKQLATERMRVLGAFLTNEKVTVITTIDAFMTPLLPLEVIKDNIFTIEKGAVIDEKAVAIKLVQMGYEKCYQVDSPGQFSIRGGIIDIFDLCMDNPVRIELWGDDVESIRSFDVLSQRSIESLEKITILPGSELLIPDDIRVEGFNKIEKDALELEEKYRKIFKTEEAHRIKVTLEELRACLVDNTLDINLESYIRYFYPDCGTFYELVKEKNCYVFLDDLERITEHAACVESEFRDSMEHRLDKGYSLRGQSEVLTSFDQAISKLSRERCVSLSGLKVNSEYDSYFNYKGDYELAVKMLPSYNGSMEMLVENLNDLKKKGSKIVILSPSRSRAKRLAQELTDLDVIASYTENENKELQNGEIYTFYGRLKTGFEYSDINFTVISEMDIFGPEVRTKKKKPKFEGGQKISSAGDLSVGDYVIHENNGLGIYKGIEKVKVDNILKDYMKIEYKDGANLYVLATNFEMVGFYASKDIKQPPRLNKLGSTEWSKTKAKVQTQVQVVAKDLVELYAVRNKRNGYQFSEDNLWQREFEELFPYEETYDQLNAINATKKDMESSKIMDRLVCGDVGFGKTEVAIRAAFKAVQDGKQVAYLVPTTILAQQHYNTFAARMKDYPVRVELLSRFKTAKEVKQILADLKKGLVDIVIGTHRLLSKDVEFSSLGLLVIDEEQRFGVSHKEKIKKMKEDVDVLTLTATPIPRTLHMSLIGIRDLSLLEEAPRERLPIQTYVMEFNEEMVREAINRELARGGQVYYVYNRVNNIDQITAEIKNLVPNATVVFAHGQMKESELERIMTDFVNNEIDVLVSTTIIETGLDIPNVNTMIIHDSDNLGLSQLYQLRGRVGRSSRTSYAFLMYRRNKVLKEVAEKRLLAIKEFTDLGSGYKIAMRDLEIRGAGTLLGKRQHGHIEAVGYDLYCKMLDEAIKEEKGETSKIAHITTIDLDVDAFIPETYIVNEAQKLDIYKRIASLWTDEDADDMRDELRDRFGNIPREAENLIKIATIKQKASKLYIKDIRGKNGRIRVIMSGTAPVNTRKLMHLINDYAGNLKLNNLKDPEFVLSYKLDFVAEKTEETLLEKVNTLIENMNSLFTE